MKISLAEKAALSRLASALPKNSEEARALVAALKQAVKATRWKPYEFEGEEEVGNEIIRLLGGNGPVFGCDDEDPEFEDFNAMISWGPAITFGGWILREGAINGKKVVGATQAGLTRIYGPKEAFATTTKKVVVPSLQSIVKLLRTKGVEINSNKDKPPRLPEGYEIADEENYQKALKILKEAFPFFLTTWMGQFIGFYVSQEAKASGKPNGRACSLVRYPNGSFRLEQ